MPPVGFEPTISAGERPQTYALDRAASGTDVSLQYLFEISKQAISYIFQAFAEKLKDYTQAREIFVIVVCGGSFAML
jgi:hypothetical protein